MKYIKKSLRTTIVLAVLLASCHEDEEVPRRSLVTGTWSLDEQSIEQAIVASGSSELELTGEEFIHYLTINGENIMGEELRLFSENTTFTFNKDSSYLIEDTSNSEVIPGSWRLSDNESQLLLNISDETLTFGIQSLSSNLMEVSFTYSEVVDNTSFQIDFKLEFTK